MEQTTHGLGEKSAEVRLQAIRTQLSTAFTLCEVVGTDIACRRSEEAHKLIEKLWHTVESVRHHLEEPHHVAPDFLTEIREELARRERRILALQERFHTLG